MVVIRWRVLLIYNFENQYLKLRLIIFLNLSTRNDRLKQQGLETTMTVIYIGKFMTQNRVTNMQSQVFVNLHFRFKVSEWVGGCLGRCFGLKNERENFFIGKPKLIIKVKFLRTNVRNKHVNIQINQGDLCKDSSEKVVGLLCAIIKMIQSLGEIFFRLENKKCKLLSRCWSESLATQSKLMAREEESKKEPIKFHYKNSRINLNQVTTLLLLHHIWDGGDPSRTTSHAASSDCSDLKVEQKSGCEKTN